MKKIIRIDDDSENTYYIPANKIIFIKRYCQYQEYSSFHKNYQMHIRVVENDRLIIKSFDTEELLDTYLATFLIYLEDFV